MVVRNASQLTVQVTARWGNPMNALQPLMPGAKRALEVRGESAITFVATYPHRTHVTSDPVYFTTAGDRRRHR